MDISKLSAVFDPSDIEWRAQQSGVNGQNAWVLAIPYINNRAIQQRLDDVLGADRWQNTYQPAPNGAGTLCGISVKTETEWVTKWDGAENTDIEAIKGGLSNAMKRAAVQWGIGRYLYQLEPQFAKCRIVGGRKDCIGNHAYIKDRNGGQAKHVDWQNPVLPLWAQPHVDIDEYLTSIREAKTEGDLKKAFQEAIQVAKAQQSAETIKVITSLKEDRKKALSEQAALNIEENLATVKAWLSKQIGSLDLIPNVPAVESVHKTIIAELKSKCSGQHFDVAPLVTDLDEAVSYRKTNLAA